MADKSDKDMTGQGLFLVLPYHTADKGDNIGFARDLNNPQEKEKAGMVSFVGIVFEPEVIKE